MASLCRENGYTPDQVWGEIGARQVFALVRHNARAALRRRLESVVDQHADPADHAADLRADLEILDRGPLDWAEGVARLAEFSGDPARAARIRETGEAIRVLRELGRLPAEA